MSICLINQAVSMLGKLACKEKRQKRYREILSSESYMTASVTQIETGWSGWKAWSVTEVAEE